MPAIRTASPHRLLHRLFVVAACALGALGVQAQDIAGASDHPLVPRYEGSEIIHHTAQAFTDHRILVAPATVYGGIERNVDATLPLEGRHTRLQYRSPEGRSALEVFRNYQDALGEAGFEPIFRCARAECGGRNFNHAAARGLAFGEYHAEQQYLAARKPRAEGDVYVALYVVQNTAPGGPNAGRAMVQLDVVEIAPMQQKMVVVEAPQMQRELAASGRVALYGLLFDTDRDTMREDSRPQLEQIATLLQQQPQLQVLIVGHTDARGSLEHNQDLSLRRARSIVDALVREHRIDRARLTPIGVGMAAPVASNRNEDGRALNRRVEIVDRGS